MDTKILIISLKKNILFVCIGVLFFIAALFFLFLAYYLNEERTTAIFVGGAFLIISLFSLYSLFSNIKHDYENGLIKKYGDYIDGYIVDIKKDFLKEERIYLCFLEYTYKYFGKQYKNTEIFDNEDIYKYFQIDQKIPLQVLTLSPEKSQLRIKKYKNNILGK